MEGLWQIRTLQPETVVVHFVGLKELVIEEDSRQYLLV